jgi:hypothetical protein
MVNNLGSTSYLPHDDGASYHYNEERGSTGFKWIAKQRPS